MDLLSSFLCPLIVRLGVTDLGLFLPDVLRQRQGLEMAAMAAAVGLSSSVSRVQRLQFIRDESRRNTGNIWKRRKKVSAFQSQCEKQQVHNGQSGLNESFTVQAFCFLSLPRKSIIRPAGPD